MATPYRIKRSAVPGKRPLITDLLPGELALNTFDAELLTRRDRPGIGTDIVRLGAGATVTNILYVTKDGNDSNTGLKLGDAKATIKGAVAAAAEGAVIKVSAGTYIEDNPIILPNQVSIVGDSLREVTVTPGNQADLFWVGTGCYIAEMSFIGDPLPYAIFAFDPLNQRFNDQSPYIQNCTNFIPQSIGLQVNGEHVLGPTKSMVLDSYTQFNPSGVGASMTNEGYAQLVSLFTICPNIAVYCGTGGACDLTNSNASFGNFGLIAEGISPLKYVGVSTRVSEENSDQFTLNLSTPTLGIVTATYDNVSGLLTAFTDAPHNFNVGMGVTIKNLEFSCPFEEPTRLYPSGAYGYIFEVKTVAPGRYVDASNLIKGNKTEIQDKALAAIALNHPDFIFPGDPGSNDRYRFYDSYRLIQQNKQEIVDKSLASVAIGFPTGFSFPDDPVPYEQNRYYDAYRLIILNKDEIVGTAWTNTFNVYPGISTTMDKCKRDLGYFIDAIATDVFIGGNTYARSFSLQYFDENGNPIADGLLGEESESIYAFEEARDLMKLAITNNLTITNLGISSGPAEYGGGGGNIGITSTAACTDVQNTIDTLVGIVTVTIGAGNTSSLPTQNLGISTTNKCARDLGYFVDAISTDVFTGGNTYSIAFTKFYFDADGNPISNGLTGEEVESVYAFVSARDLMKNAITNQLNVKDLTVTADPVTGFNTDPASCANVQSNINTLVGIVTQAITAGNLTTLNSITLNPGTFTDGGSKCRRDIGFIVDAVTLDVRDFTNKNIINATRAYFTRDGQPLADGVIGEEQETITAFHAVRDLSKKAINNLLNFQDLTIQVDPITLSNQDPASCANVQTTIDNLVGILTTAVGLGTLTSLPNVSMASTQFSINVGIATQAHTYEGGGEVKVNVARPFDGQVVYFGDLFYSVGSVLVGSGGTGYLDTPIVTIDDPDTEFGIPAQAVAEIRDGKVIAIEMVSSGRGYTRPPRISITSPDVGINTAILTPRMIPTYYFITDSTELTPTGICTITVSENVPYEVGIGTTAFFFKQSRVLASGQAMEYIGTGVTITSALPQSGGIRRQENETDAIDGGLVVFTSTDQSGNFRIGDGVVINQQTGTISGTFYSKSLFSTLTPFILALGGD
jgi:hypothetical protein